MTRTIPATSAGVALLLHAIDVSPTISFATADTSDSLEDSLGRASMSMFVSINLSPTTSVLSFKISFGPAGILFPQMVQMVKLLSLVWQFHIQPSTQFIDRCDRFRSCASEGIPPFKSQDAAIMLSNSSKCFKESRLLPLSHQYLKLGPLQRLSGIATKIAMLK
jgi:hypothetical protein